MALLPVLAARKGAAGILSPDRCSQCRPRGGRQSITLPGVTTTSLPGLPCLSTAPPYLIRPGMSPCLSPRAAASRSCQSGKASSAGLVCALPFCTAASSS